MRRLWISAFTCALATGCGDGAPSTPLPTEPLAPSAAAPTLPSSGTAGSPMAPETVAPSGSPEPGATPAASAPTEPTSPLPAASAEAPQCPDLGLDAAVVRYVCDCQPGAAAECVPGDDSNAGTPEAPWQTYGAARDAFAELGAGETIAFCRGGSFAVEDSRRWTNPLCAADAPCVVRDYTPGWAATDSARPRLTAQDGNGFDFDDPGNANHEEGYVLLNLDLQAPSAGGTGLFVYNDVDDLLLCGLRVDGFSIGLHVSGSNAADADSNGRNERIVLRRSQIINNSGQGFLGSCDGCSIEFNSFENNGFAQAVLNHNIYFDAHTLATGMRVVGNDLYRSAVIDGQCEGVSLAGHGLLDDLLIEGNTVREDVGAAGIGCWGIAIDPGWAAEAEEFHDVVIRGNTVLNVGNVGIGLASCDNCVVENNVVIQQQDISSRLVAVPNRDGAAGDLVSSRTVVRNNTLLADSSSSITAIEVGSQGNEHLIVNNAVVSTGSGSVTCFGYDLSRADYVARDNNICFALEENNLRWASDSASLEAWQSASGADVRSQVVDPLLSSLQAPLDLVPRTDSPLVGAGAAELAPLLDYTGNPRDSQPDIGAFEVR